MLKAVHAEARRGIPALEYARSDKLIPVAQVQFSMNPNGLLHHAPGNLAPFHQTLRAPAPPRDHLTPQPPEPALPRLLRLLLETLFPISLKRSAASPSLSTVVSDGLHARLGSVGTSGLPIDSRNTSARNDRLPWGNK